MNKNLLIVDDEEWVRKIECLTLENSGYCCTSATCPAEAREHLQQREFDLAILDVTMPGESGLELATEICTETSGTAVLMVTGEDDPSIAKVALEIGTYGYLVKPFQPNELLINVAGALHRHELEIEKRSHREKLEETVQERTASLQEAIGLVSKYQKHVQVYQGETILRLARAAEYRDEETGEHVNRMSRYCTLLFQRMGHDSSQCELIRLASILHDIGKIGVEDRILRKPGPLTPHEFEMMKQHVEIGQRILAGSDSELLQLAASIAWTHHERYDGSGYPRGICGDDIPLEGRAAAIADVFDALTSNRIYRPAYPLEKALNIMSEHRGKDFDPFLLDLFFASLEQILAIKDEHADANPQIQVPADDVTFVRCGTWNLVGASRLDSPVPANAMFSFQEKPQGSRCVGESSLVDY